MSDAAEPLLDADHAAFIQSGVSIVVASRDATNAPRVARALGCRVSADRRRVTVYLGAFQAAPLLAAIRAEGAIAVAFNLPSTHRAFQLKGTDAAAVPLDRSDVEHAQRYVDAFAADIGLLGYAEAYGRALLWFDPAELTGIAFTPAAAFEQTPGPRAGVRLGASAMALTLDAIRACLEGGVPEHRGDLRRGRHAQRQRTCRRCTTSTAATSRCRSSSSTRRARTCSRTRAPRRW